MIEFETTVQIDQPAQRVFAVLVDFESYLARWAKGPIAAKKLSGDGGAGTRYMVTAKVGPIKVRSPYDVKSSVPPTSFSGAGIAGPVRFEETYVLSEDGSQTILTQSIRAKPRGPFQLVRGPLDE